MATDLEKAYRIERAILELTEACWDCDQALVNEIVFTKPILLPAVPNPFADENEDKSQWELEAMAKPKRIAESFPIGTSFYQSDFNMMRLTVTAF